MSISIFWFVDGVLVQSGGTVLPTLFRDQNISVELSPSDPFEISNTETVQTVILNSPPQGAILRIDPENRRDNR